MAQLNPLCFPNQILGCIYPNAINFNPNATVNDGSCVFIGKSFNIAIRASHYTQCVSSSGTQFQVGFILHIDSITPSQPVIDLKTIISFKAYTTSLPELKFNCLSTNPRIISNIALTNGIQFRRNNDKDTNILLSGELPKYSQVFAGIMDGSFVATTHDTDIIDGNVNGITNPLPIKVKIIADGEIYTGTFTIGINSYGTVTTTDYEIITVQ